jgi:hypothetical protein
VLNQITPLGEGKEQIKSFKLTRNPILLNIGKTKVKTLFLNISIGSPKFSQTKQTRRCFFCLKFCQLVTQKQKKQKNVWPKEFWGKFLENSQNYEEEKGRRCHI